MKAGKNSKILPESQSHKIVGHELKLGLYKHFKGGRYEVIGIAKHSESQDELVVYRALYGEKKLWVRPLIMFTEKVELEGKKVPRFSYIGVS